MSTELLGWRVKDKFSGYVGIVSAYSDYAYSSGRIGVATTKEGLSASDSIRHFDIQQVEKIGETRYFEPTDPGDPVVNLKDFVVDEITGFSGVVIGITTWLYGCRRVIVQSKELSKDGFPISPESFDEARLIVKNPVVVSTESNEQPVQEKPKTGGPRDDPQQVADPIRW